MLYQNLSINESGHLVFAGYDTTQLAAQFGTALMVMDEMAIRNASEMERLQKNAGDNVADQNARRRETRPVNQNLRDGAQKAAYQKRAEIVK